MTFAMENIKKVFRTYFFWVVVHAVLGLIFLIQALWVSAPIRYQSGAQEEFFIQRTSSSKQPCLTLSSSIRGILHSYLELYLRMIIYAHCCRIIYQSGLIILSSLSDGAQMILWSSKRRIHYFTEL